ncbi:hypothetical protein RJ641_014305 [Dillenia turbinata]|uniref:Uncharacterized protein n=1 Tax=Dillenia turbinata TaxID=194707 RepID=A0AAN8Z194_9MAGN
MGVELDLGTSSMVAAIGYSWLLENKKEDGDVVVSVISRERRSGSSDKLRGYFTMCLLSTSGDVELLGTSGDGDTGSNQSFSTPPDHSSSSGHVIYPSLKENNELLLSLLVVQDQKDGKFFEALRHNHGRPPSEMHVADRDGGASMEHKVPERKSPFGFHHDSSMQNLDKHFRDAKSVKSNNGSPESGKDLCLYRFPSKFSPIFCPPW